jgi:WD40 repeat protein
MEIASGRRLAILEIHTSWIVSMAFSPDSRNILTGSSGGTARLWETASGQVFTILAGHTNWVVSAVFSSNGSRILTISYDGSARLWETASGRLLATSVELIQGS